MDPDTPSLSTGLAALNSLRRFVRPRSTGERCALCDAELADVHPHLVELATRRLTCACDACAVLFSDQSAARYRRVSRRVRLLDDVRFLDDLWARLQLPIDLAFLVHDSAAGTVVARYPSPGGVIESAVDVESWQVLVEENPVLRGLEPDVEVLLMNRIGSTRESYFVGIDEAYRLAGLLRQHWQGFSGGPALWSEVARFFDDLRRRAS